MIQIYHFILKTSSEIIDFWLIFHFPLFIAGPFVLIFVPVLYICVRIFDGRLGLQILNNIATIMIANYGVLATLFLIYFNDPYQKFFTGNLRRTIGNYIHSLCNYTLLSICSLIFRCTNILESIFI
uniref:G_PROTEIN_RECEP_F1_2 domain-containing protein n=1 Tax=Heterorhabditis bacteriophora TaxID=37862 RepID=A0A1I7WHJ7_HETBA